MHCKNPDSFIVAALTLSPIFLSTGIDSPVRADSFTALTPEITSPSTEILSPGLTINISPTLTSPIATSFSSPSFNKTAVLGASFISDLSASVVLPFDIASSILPTVIRVGIIAADSKYNSS